ncbi:major facilitator superfamily domain-containing protein [Cyathus striatus]|nr:major facilitator superfamily domain-containing protein [Cyathus striatus]
MSVTIEQATPSHDSSGSTTCETTNNATTEFHTTLDMEHAPVKNDPRAWSPLRKNLCVAQIASASLIAGLAANIQNPAVEEMERDLPATSTEFSLSISLFILLHGLVPLLWSAISEIKGRRFVYLISLGLFTVGSVVVAISKNIGLLSGLLRSSAVMALGAATLADIFEPAERGTKASSQCLSIQMGIYYMAPLLGSALGPIFGGVLTTGLGWRAISVPYDSLWGNICFLFAYGFLLTYTTARTLGSKYGYSPLKIGLVTLSYGLGCVAGSFLGGWWSDRELARLKATYGGKSYRK